MKSLRERKACHLNREHINYCYTWRDIERKMRQRRRHRRNHNQFWTNRIPEGNTRRIMRERAGQL